MIDETQKILNSKIDVFATCVRVPVFVGHSESVNVEFNTEVNAKKVRECLEKANGCKVIDEIKDGEILLETKYLSLDPYMRGRMNADKSYAPPVPVGGIMEGECVAEVVDSKNPNFENGEIVVITDNTIESIKPMLFLMELSYVKLIKNWPPFLQR